MSLQFNEFEESFLKENWSNMTIAELAKSLHRSYASIYGKLRKMGLIDGYDG